MLCLTQLNENPFTTEVQPSYQGLILTESEFLIAASVLMEDGESKSQDGNLNHAIKASPHLTLGAFKSLFQWLSVIMVASCEIGGRWLKDAVNNTVILKAS